MQHLSLAELISPQPLRMTLNDSDKWMKGVQVYIEVRDKSKKLFYIILFLYVQLDSYIILLDS
jgi:hypothetical protein